MSDTYDLNHVCKASFPESRTSESERVERPWVVAAKQAVHERNRAGHNATNVMRELESRMAGVVVLVVYIVHTRTRARTTPRTT